MGRAFQLLDSTRGDQRRHRMELKVMLADIRAGKRRLDEAIDQLIFQKRMVDIAALLAEMSDLQEAHVSNVLHKVNATGIGIVCRALNVGETTYDRLSRLRCEKLRLPATQADQMTADFNMIDLVTAERSLRFHRVRNSTQVLGAG
jgi:Uncharacterised protein conserved in bacteria (DUF2336)